MIEKATAGRAAVNRRADVALYVNGLPLAVLELKNPGDENATIDHAFNQLQTYKQDIPTLFTTNEPLVISDGLREYGYPPDLQQAATELVIEQAEVLCSGWSQASH